MATISELQPVECRRPSIHRLLLLLLSGTSFLGALWSSVLLLYQTLCYFSMAIYTRLFSNILSDFAVLWCCCLILCALALLCNRGALLIMFWVAAVWYSVLVPRSIVSIVTIYFLHFLLSYTICCCSLIVFLAMSVCVAALWYSLLSLVAYSLLLFIDVLCIVAFRNSVLPPTHKFYVLMPSHLVSYCSLISFVLWVFDILRRRSLVLILWHSMHCYSLTVLVTVLCLCVWYCSLVLHLLQILYYFSVIFCYCSLNCCSLIFSFAVFCARLLPSITFLWYSGLLQFHILRAASL